jgi:hypothetical protein
MELLPLVLPAPHNLKVVTPILILRISRSAAIHVRRGFAGDNQEGGVVKFGNRRPEAPSATPAAAPPAGFQIHVEEGFGGHNKGYVTFD